ncbi:hypothetical protein D3W54_07135 [Komagataeibacter medellinensis]|uniref:Uncharacterized protein n=1 Tax=Komagataeibacter medellinensis TaxID=1177712 RepID=A0ABQ6VUX9_9PROT|nr:hypothetical protein [Komagataeibacter medellinensis]KAB8124016.1 hypothetical protein D3W54_07135 [Komagataeibacter medellinensis]
MTAIVCDNTGCLTFTLSDGSIIGPVVFSASVAKGLGGTRLVAADSDGTILINEKTAFGRDAQERLAIMGALPTSADGLEAGSGVLYRNADGTLGMA